jgi:Chemotaxis response regulator containing a CheY-like receiver domain and a methylesterase domain
LTPPIIVAIGTSWGGLSALSRIVAALPADLPAPVVVVQHRGKDSNNLLADLLQAKSQLQIREAEDKDPLVAGRVYVAPADYHLLVDSDEISLSTEEPVRYSRPSIDVMFDSVAESHGAGAIGVVLTGANEDGARGLARIVALGGRAIVQDPETAEVPIMPTAARKLVPAAEILPLEEIAPRLVKLARAAAGPKRKAG